MKPLVGLFAVVCLLASGSSFANKLYRFTVDGRVVVKDHIPTEYSHLGYEVLNSSGMVVKTVAPAPTAEELAQRRAEEAAKKARQDAITAQRKLDLDLLRLYAKPSDVERARQRKADEIDSYIQLQRRRIVDLEQKLEKAQAQAANIERRGQEVPADMRLEIVQLQNGIRDSEGNIKARQQEMKESTRDFAEQYERVRILQVYPAGTLDDDVDLDKVDRELEGKKD
ncbi:DUF4124 domain-containing protein [Thalassolituus sp. C2-1]|uniref:DUF4124 domain-containing protein n=1 Tax=Venatorbacter sp. C2-1 TaxID=2597518 RepID=UPI000C5B839E|nr:DUF4124 domain-containing protein [Thalassolituus sp. C2-1]MBU2039355.1 DUF4124 domain-containing protein [Gammaproteobacteria bacterium]PIQ40174.1 MAG: hypothetical protein COW58_07625 [Thalassolituus sp. CG17_big_fil_post_rev_8_21_14_2_50_53_8]TVV44754.1 DUF4124 domain-containing protein [Thalassolituus sp. C2-1]